MGQKYGYEHLWEEANGELDGDGSQITWFNGTHFYSLTSSTEKGDKGIFGRIGANDPNFNLRRDPVFIYRRENTGSTLFANVIEIHGKYDPSDEIPHNLFSSVAQISVLTDTKEYSAVQFELTNQRTYVFCISNQDTEGQSVHSLELQENVVEWVGPFTLQEL